MTLHLANSLNMHLKMNQNRTRTSNYEDRLNRPNPASQAAVLRAQPFRADTVKKMEAIIKDPSYQITE
jgi:hypothetical protein